MDRALDPTCVSDRRPLADRAGFFGNLLLLHVAVCQPSTKQNEGNEHQNGAAKDRVF